MVAQIVGDQPKGLVVLGSRGPRQRVLAEFETYSQFVSVGSYVIVEDTIVGGHPVWPSFGAGPGEAAKQIINLHHELVLPDLTASATRSASTPGATSNACSEPGGSASAGQVTFALSTASHGRRGQGERRRRSRSCGEDEDRVQGRSGPAQPWLRGARSPIVLLPPHFRAVVPLAVLAPQGARRGKGQDSWIVIWRPR